MKSKDLLLLAAATLITVIVWVGLETYRTYSIKQLPESVQKLATPLNATIPEGVFQKLEATQP